jgi:hypothetical protein
MASLGCPWPIHSITVALTWADISDKPMPNEGRLFLEFYAVNLLSVFVKEADFNRCRVFRIDSKVRTICTRSSAERVRLSRQKSSLHSLASFKGTCDG